MNLVVALMVIGGLTLDYRHQLAGELRAYRAALSDEARALLPGAAELRHHGLSTVQRYVDAVCAAMQDRSSPGHHIVVDIGDDTIQAQSHNRDSDVILTQIRMGATRPGGRLDADGVPLVVGDARSGDLRAFVAERSEPVIARIRAQALARLLTLTGIGVIGALLVNIVLMHQVTRPVSELARVVRRIGAGELGARPGRFATDELDLLAGEIGRMSTDLEHRERDRAAHLSKAQRIQRRLLPAVEPDDAVAVVYRPADTVAGDYYDLLTLPDGSLLVCIADVCGHGVPAAMGAAILKTLLLSATERYTSLSEIPRHINERFLRVSLTEDFASMVLVRLDPTLEHLEFVNAGHEPCYLLRATGDIQRLESTGMLLGVSPDACWKTERIARTPLDRLVLLTDGVAEAADRSGRHFGRAALVAELENRGRQSAAEIANAIISSLDNHCGDADVNDDQTILVLGVQELLARQVRS